MDIIRITPDKEKARSMLKMVSLLEERIKVQDRKKMAALIITDYYEIIKELTTAILLIDGYKTLSHKALVEYINRYSEFTSHEISIMDDLRILRNRTVYEGFFIEPSYLDRNESLFKSIMQKMKDFIKRKMNNT